MQILRHITLNQDDKERTEREKHWEQITLLTSMDLLSYDLTTNSFRRIYVIVHVNKESHTTEINIHFD